MLSIPTGWDYDAIKRGAVLKHVKCENCPCNYVYKLEREGEGSASSGLFSDGEEAKMKAAKEAEEELEKQLKEDIDPVPCPACGWYQKKMQESLQFKRYIIPFIFAVLLWLASFLLVIARISMTIQLNPSPEFITYTLPVAFGCALLGYGIFWITGKLSESYHPNEVISLEERLAIARKKAITLEEYEQLTAAYEQPPEA